MAHILGTDLRLVRSGVDLMSFHLIVPVLLLGQCQVLQHLKHPQCHSALFPWILEDSLWDRKKNPSAELQDCSPTMLQVLWFPPTKKKHIDRFKISFLAHIGFAIINHKQGNSCLGVIYYVFLLVTI